jgi:hypothetical protein
VTLQPEDPYYSMCDKGGQCREHRLVMARFLGRRLESWEVVHHKNGNKSDNRIENLELMHTITHHLIDTNVKAHIARQELRIKALEARVTLLESENILLRQDNDNKVCS